MGFPSEQSRSKKLRLAVIFIGGPIALLFGLVIAGCVSRALPNLFFVRIKGSNASTVITQGVQVRFGYVGTCISQAAELGCAASSGPPIDRYISLLTTNSSTIIASGKGSALAILMSVSIQGRLLLCLLGSSCACFGIDFVYLLFIICGMRGLLPKTPSRRSFITRTVLALAWLSFGLCLVATIALTQTVASLQGPATTIIGSPVTFDSGITMQALQWVLSGLTGLFALSLSFLFREDGGSSDSGGGYDVQAFQEPPMAPPPLDGPGSQGP